MFGRTVVVAPQFFASSKLCSVCGQKNEELRLADRRWQCTSCHAEHDRDLNAACNLRDYAIQIVKERAVSSTVQACGEPSVGTLCEAGR